MKLPYKHIFPVLLLLACINKISAQLIITNESNGLALAQKLVGNGVVISNVVLTGDLRATGFFDNISGTLIGIDSGIVLTNGRAKTIGNTFGLDGDGTIPASAVLADLQQFPTSTYSGDVDLANSIGVPASETHDACILEFDFIPLGDTVKFRYVFSSEEYTPAFVCLFNDAFAFFISGPGIAGLKNIALIPGTNTPVSIFNVNNVPGGSCPNNQAYYKDNTSNLYLTHDGLTTVLTALSAVQPCKTYHLKMVIADVSDGFFDSGVFLEAKSLSSNSIQIHNLTQTDVLGNSYLVEGCVSGSFRIRRNDPDPIPLTVDLSYGGTATNGVDVQLLPSTVIIPANDTSVTVNVIPIIDNIPEGIETLKIYAQPSAGGCGAGIPTDSAIIQIRDYDTLGIIPDTAFICKHSAYQLNATAGYSTYLWVNDPTLSSLIIRDPVATPVNFQTTYICTATEGTCNAKDSAFIKWKSLQLFSKTDVNCHNGTTGEIRVKGGPEWARPALYSVNNLPYQADSTFGNLPTGVYTVKIKDALNCVDSLVINILQKYPDLLISDTLITGSSCTGSPDGMLTVQVTGGNSPFSYSLDGMNFQSGNQFNFLMGNYVISVKDNSGCVVSQPVFVPLNNIVTLDAGADFSVCEGKSKSFQAISNANKFKWTPALYLNDNTIQDPLVSPLATTGYVVTAIMGICSRTDSITVFFNPAPVAEAGNDTTICFGKSIRLNGSGSTVYRWFPQTFLNNAAIYNPVVQKPYNTITYFLNVGDAKGCVSLQKDSVTITVIPEARLFAGRDTLLALNQPLPLMAIDVHHSNFSSYTWDPIEGLNNPFIPNPIAVPLHDITYTVNATTINGCEASDDIYIKVYRGSEIYVPTAFSPNRNGLNSILKATAVGMRTFNYFRIFDRWGKVVFETTDPGRGWDGKINGIPNLTGTYIWMAEAVDFKGKIIQRRGTCILIN